MHAYSTPSIEQICSRADKAFFATVGHNPDHVMSQTRLRGKSRCTSCDLECTTEFSQRQTTGCVELFSLGCYILITRVYECILPCMFCITMSVTHNAVCNCEIKSILTYLAYLVSVRFLI